jgi:hypothetical protein
MAASVFNRKIINKKVNYRRQFTLFGNPNVTTLLSQFEAVEIHNFVPRCNKIFQEFFLRI